jgi:pyruvate dehydrogenase kinase 2/3/4
MSSIIKKYSQLKQTPISLRDLFRYNRNGVGDPAQRIRNAQFLHRELPIRIAQRIEELSAVPFNLSTNKYICDVKNIFIIGFEKLLTCKKPETLSDDKLFTYVLTNILKDHNTVIQSIALGIIDAKRSLTYTSSMNQILNLYLNRFFAARIGVRFLIEHHIAALHNKDGYSGIIQSNCNPAEVAQLAAEESISLCEREMGVSPEINILCPNSIRFTYVPSHLHYILSEIFKNALRATIIHNGTNETVPAVEVILVKGASDVTIKVSDKGGGIPFDKIEKVWMYVSTSGKSTYICNETGQKIEVNSLQFKDASIDLIQNQLPALSGYGCGLPLSRLYAQYFGGGLDLKSMEGYGTDAYVHLNRHVNLVII